MESRPSAAKTMARAFADADLREVLPRIRVPTLLLYGDADVRAPGYVAAAMHAAIPGSRLVTFPGVGHLVNVEAPERFDEVVRAFLTEQDHDRPSAR